MASDVAWIIRNAIRKEVAARSFYMKARRAAADPGARRLLGELAREEARHATILRGKGLAAFLATPPPLIQDLRITEFLEPRKISPRASFQETLIHAMKREDAAYWGYQALAEAAEEKTARAVLHRLALEERMHRNRLEQLYDDLVFVED